MTQDQWTAVDRYITDLLVPSDLALDATLQATADAGMPQINVAPNQGGGPLGALVQATLQVTVGRALRLCITSNWESLVASVHRTRSKL